MRFCIIRALGLALLPLAVISQNFHGSSPPKPGYGTLSPFGAFSSKPLIVPENATSEEKAEYDKLISGKGEGLGPFSAGGIFQAAILESRTEKPPVLNKQAKRIITRFGAYGLVPAGTPKDAVYDPAADPSAQAFLLQIPMNESFCADCTILSTKFTLTYQNGTAVKNSDEIYLSALLTKDLQKSGADYISPCPANSPKRVFFAGGATFIGVSNDLLDKPLLFSNPDSKTGAGYHIKADDSIAIKFELIDLKKETDDIYLTFDTEYLPTIVGINTQQSLVSTTGCVPKHVPISEKAMNVTSEKYTIQRDGKIIYAKGYLHEGGTKLHLIINDKTVCSTEARYGSASSAIIETTSCLGVISVQKGDIATVVAEYDTTKHPRSSKIPLIGDGGATGMWNLLFA